MMKRFVVVVGAALLVTLPSGLAQGIDGPDPEAAPLRFALDFKGGDEVRGQFLINERWFDRADGWDFGDRTGYNCAWVEYYEVPSTSLVAPASGRELFEIHFTRLLEAPWMQIVDRNGPEDEQSGMPKYLCGDGDGDTRTAPTFDGSDHFPHGTSMTFTLDGHRLAKLDLHEDECASGYWTPGDQPGEAWLWWDDDGPTNDGHHDLDCGGGPGDPVPVVRAKVRHLGEGVGICSEDMLGGDVCRRTRDRDRSHHLRQR